MRVQRRAFPHHGQTVNPQHPTPSQYRQNARRCQCPRRRCRCFSLLSNLTISLQPDPGSFFVHPRRRQSTVACANHPSGCGRETRSRDQDKDHESRREGVARLLTTELVANTWCLKSQSHKFINAYAAFLKRQGKLPVPGESNQPLMDPAISHLRVCVAWVADG